MSGTDRDRPTGRGQQAGRADGPGDEDHEVQREGEQDDPAVGRAEPVAQLPRSGSPRHEREEGDRDRAPDQRVPQRPDHGARPQTTASSVSGEDRPAGWRAVVGHVPGHGLDRDPVDRLDDEWLAGGQGHGRPQDLEVGLSGRPDRASDAAGPDRRSRAPANTPSRIADRGLGVSSASSPNRAQDADLELDRARSRSTSGKRQRRPGLQHDRVPAVARQDPRRPGRRARFRGGQRGDAADAPDRVAPATEHDPVGAVAVGDRGHRRRVAGQGAREVPPTLVLPDAREDRRIEGELREARRLDGHDRGARLVPDQRRPVLVGQDRRARPAHGQQVGRCPGRGPARARRWA